MHFEIKDKRYDVSESDHILTIEIDADSFGKLCWGYQQYLEASFSNCRTDLEEQEYLADLNVIHLIDSRFPTTTLGEPHK